MAKKKTKKVTGRPTQYDPGYCPMLIEHMREGYSLESFGGVISKGKQTLYNWRDKHPDFRDAIEIGFAACQLFWERKGIEGNETIKDPDGMTVTRSIPPAVWIFNMKNRFTWRDVQEVKTTAEITHQTAAEKEVKELTAVLAEMLRGAA